MENKKAVWQRKIRIDDEILSGQEEINLIYMICAIGEELSMNPEIYSDGKRYMWIYYQRSLFDCGTIFKEYGYAAALISVKYPVVFMGNTDSLEEVFMKAVFTDDNNYLLMEKCGISGNDFEAVENFCVKVDWGKAEILDEYMSSLSHLTYGSKVFPVRRTRHTEKTFSGLPQLSEDTYYRYIILDDTADITDGINALTVYQIQKLWSLLLDDGVSPAECSYALEALEQEKLDAVFSWKLALRLALEHCKFEVHLGEDGFYTSSDGNRQRNYDYEEGTDAQRLLLKLFFPVPVKR